MLSPNCSGVCEEVAKLTDEKDTAPDETSGTLERVFFAVLHLMRLWMLVTVSATSFGRTELPITKQALAWRSARGERVDDDVGAVVRMG